MMSSQILVIRVFCTLLTEGHRLLTAGLVRIAEVAKSVHDKSLAQPKCGRVRGGRARQYYILVGPTGADEMGIRIWTRSRHTPETHVIKARASCRPVRSGISTNLT